MSYITARGFATVATTPFVHWAATGVLTAEGLEAQAASARQTTATVNEWIRIRRGRCCRDANTPLFPDCCARARKPITQLTVLRVRSATLSRCSVFTYSAVYDLENGNCGIGKDKQLRETVGTRTA